MPHQYKREPLSDGELNRLTNACETFEEKFIIWTLLDTGLRVGEFANLKKDNIQWQEKRLIIYGKGGPYGKKTKSRILPMTARVKRLIDHLLTIHNDLDRVEEVFFPVSFTLYEKEWVFSAPAFASRKFPNYLLPGLLSPFYLHRRAH